MHMPTSTRFPTIAGLLLLLTTACQSAPTPAPAPSPADAAAEAEVRQVIDGVYAWVSGPQGTPKDRKALLALFVPDGRLVVAQAGPNGASMAQSMPVGAFADMVVQGATQRSFYEAPIRTRVDVFGGIATAWSSFASRHAPEQPPFERGINCFTLVRTANGWRIASVAWAVETATTKLPADMAGG
jgi:hypothetical protein